MEECGNYPVKEEEEDDDGTEFEAEEEITDLNWTSPSDEVDQLNLDTEFVAVHDVLDIKVEDSTVTCRDQDVKEEPNWSLGYVFPSSSNETQDPIGTNQIVYNGQNDNYYVIVTDHTYTTKPPTLTTITRTTTSPSIVGSRSVNSACGTSGVVSQDASSIRNRTVSMPNILKKPPGARSQNPDLLALRKQRSGNYKSRAENILQELGINLSELTHQPKGATHGVQNDTDRVGLHSKDDDSNKEAEIPPLVPLGNDTPSTRKRHRVPIDQVPAKRKVQDANTKKKQLRNLAAPSGIRRKCNLPSVISRNVLPKKLDESKSKGTDDSDVSQNNSGKSQVPRQEIKKTNSDKLDTTLNNPSTILRHLLVKPTSYHPNTGNPSIPKESTKGRIVDLYEETEEFSVINENEENQLPAIEDVSELQEIEDDDTKPMVREESAIEIDNNEEIDDDGNVFIVGDDDYKDYEDMVTMHLIDKQLEELSETTFVETAFHRTPREENNVQFVNTAGNRKYVKWPKSTRDAWCAIELPPKKKISSTVASNNNAGCSSTKQRNFGTATSKEDSSSADELEIEVDGASEEWIRETAGIDISELIFTRKQFCELCQKQFKKLSKHLLRVHYEKEEVRTFSRLSIPNLGSQRSNARRQILRDWFLIANYAITIESTYCGLSSKRTCSICLGNVHREDALLHYFQYTRTDFTKNLVPIPLKSVLADLDLQIIKVRQEMSQINVLNLTKSLLVSIYVINGGAATVDLLLISDYRRKRAFHCVVNTELSEIMQDIVKPEDMVNLSKVLVQRNCIGLPLFLTSRQEHAVELVLSCRKKFESCYIFADPRFHFRKRLTVFEALKRYIKIDSIPRSISERLERQEMEAASNFKLIYDEIPVPKQQQQQQVSIREKNKISNVLKAFDAKNVTVVFRTLPVARSSNPTTSSPSNTIVRPQFPNKVVVIPKELVQAPNKDVEVIEVKKEATFPAVIEISDSDDSDDSDSMTSGDFRAETNHSEVVWIKEESNVPDEVMGDVSGEDIATNPESVCSGNEASFELLDVNVKSARCPRTSNLSDAENDAVPSGSGVPTKKPVRRKVPPRNRVVYKSSYQCGNLSNKTLQWSTRRKNKYYCTFCKEPISVISQHLELRHADCATVQEMLSHPKGCEERLKFLRTISSRGMFVFHRDSPYSGEKIVLRRVNPHPQKLRLPKQDSQKDPLATTTTTKKMQSACKDLLVTQTKFTENDINEAIKTDKLLILFQNHMWRRRRTLEWDAPSNLKLAAKFFLTMKATDSSIGDFSAIYHPRHRDTVTKVILGAARRVSKTTSFVTNEVSRKMKEIVMTCGFIWSKECMQTKRSEDRKMALEFLRRFDEIYQNGGVFAKPECPELPPNKVRIPKKLAPFSRDMFLKAAKLLKDGFTLSLWIDLANFLLVYISASFLNNDISEDAQTLLLSHYLQRCSPENLEGNIFASSASFLLTQEFCDAMDVLVENRVKAAVPVKNVYLFGRPRRKDHYQVGRAAKHLKSRAKSEAYTARTRNPGEISKVETSVEDLRKAFECYSARMSKLDAELRQEFTPPVWMDLTKCVSTCVQLLNDKTYAEAVQYLLIIDYYGRCEKIGDDEDLCGFSSIGDLGGVLFKVNVQRTSIDLLLSLDIIRSLDLLIETRHSACVHRENPFLFACTGGKYHYYTNQGDVDIFPVQNSEILPSRSEIIQLKVSRSKLELLGNARRVFNYSRMTMLELKRELDKAYAYEIWLDLLKSLLAYLHLLNNRSIEYPEVLSINNYTNRRSVGEDEDQSTYHSLTELSDFPANYFKISPHGNDRYLLVSLESCEAAATLLSHRESAGVHADNPLLFGCRGNESCSFQSYGAIAQVAVKWGVQRLIYYKAQNVEGKVEMVEQAVHVSDEFMDEKKVFSNREGTYPDLTSSVINEKNRWTREESVAAAKLFQHCLIEGRLPSELEFETVLHRHHELRNKNAEQIEDLLKDWIGNQTRREAEDNSRPGNSSCSSNHPFSLHGQWNAVEKRLAKSHFAGHLRTKTLPSTEECKRAIDLRPELSSKNPHQLRNWIYSQNRDGDNPEKE